MRVYGPLHYHDPMNTYFAVAAILVASFGLGYMVQGMRTGQLTDRRLLISSVLTVIAGLLLVATFLT